MRVVALDLSIAATGVARHDGLTETIAPKSSGDYRLVGITTAVSVVVGEDRPAVVVIEDVPMGLRNAAAGVLGMVHGAVRLTLMHCGVRYVTIPPASLKTYATGRGNAPKPDMRMELYKRVGLDLSDDNKVDAWWLRAMALDAYGLPVVDLPKTHTRALEKVEWPDVRGEAA